MSSEVNQNITSRKTLAEKIDEIGKICIPGMRLSPCNDEFISGSGTNEIMGYIYASVSGVLKMTKNESSQVTTVSVESPKTPSILPKTGDIVTARVTVVNPRMVYCTILCVNADVLTRTYRGIIKKEDIRYNLTDQLDPYKCFRPGDIILAKVLPVTEIHYYPLSTAENEFGVVIATAEGSPLGVNMVPISWSEMQCPKTLVKEKRKVARVIPERLDQNIPDIQENGESSSNKENHVDSDENNL